MKKLKQTIFFCLSLTSINTFSQPKSTIDYLTAYSIQFLGKTDSGSSIEGTGFYYTDSGLLFFITARHMIFDTYNDPIKKTFVFAYKPNIKKAQLFSYNEKINKKYLEINIEKLYKDNLLFYYKDYDIVIIQLGAADLKTNYLKVDNRYVTHVDTICSLSKNHIYKYNDIDYGDDIAIVGYPNSIGMKSLMQYDYKKPLFKKGYIAGKYPELSTLIIDCEVYHGNSGGPVFKIKPLLSEKDYSKDSPEYGVVGIITQTIPYLAEGEIDSIGNKNKTFSYVSSTYSVAVSFDIVLEMIEQYKEIKKGFENNTK